MRIKINLRLFHYKNNSYITTLLLQQTQMRLNTYTIS